MKSFTIAFAVAVAFGACACAAPQEAPVSNYDPLMVKLEEVALAMPESEIYVDELGEDLEYQKEAAQSGNIREMSKSVLKAMKDTKKGSHSVESNAKLFNIADVTAPNALRDLAAGFVKGTKDAEDENDLMGEFIKMVQDALANPN